MGTKNNTVIVTGAAQGIGLCCVKLFSESGSKIIACDINIEELKNQTESIENVSIFRLDVAQEENWEKLSQYIEKNYKKGDVLVNCAGITGNEANFGPQDPENINITEWRKVHEVNLDGIVLGCKYALKSFLKKKDGSSSIINMSSRGGLVGVPYLAAYASSKSAVGNFTKSVALYCADKGYTIRCNSLHPAAIETKMTESFLGDNDVERQKRRQFLASSIPLGRLGKPEEVAKVALFLASEDSSYITGSEIRIDGGSLSGAPSVSKFTSE